MLVGFFSSREDARRVDEHALLPTAQAVAPDWIVGGAQKYSKAVRG